MLPGNLSEIRSKLMECGLKITPQRMAVMDAILTLNNHPTAENIADHIKIQHPNIAVGTVYKALETFVENGLVKKVTTERDIMRYDAITENHHHLYFSDSDKIEDYYNEELNSIIEEYFAKKNIPNFNIEEIRLQIVGRKAK